MVQILAHKTVLSSASSIFQELLLINSNSNPILYLKGVKHAELESILQFIYLGEAKVLENRLDLFVSASKELKIKELNKSQEEVINVSKELKIKDLNKKQEEFENISKELNRNHEEVENVNEIIGDFESVVKTEELLETDKASEFNDSSHETQETLLKQTQKSSICPVCKTTFSSAGNMQKHYHKSHSTAQPQFSCNKCPKTFNQKGNLSRHMQARHKIF